MEMQHNSCDVTCNVEKRIVDSGNDDWIARKKLKLEPLQFLLLDHSRRVQDSYDIPSHVPLPSIKEFTTSVSINMGVHSSDPSSQICDGSSCCALDKETKTETAPFLLPTPMYHYNPLDPPSHRIYVNSSGSAPSSQDKRPDESTSFQQFIRSILAPESPVTSAPGSPSSPKAESSTARATSASSVSSSLTSTSLVQNQVPSAMHKENMTRNAHLRFPLTDHASVLFKRIQQNITTPVSTVNSRFHLLEQPNPIQRKSYKKENRCLLPNPLSIRLKNPSDAALISEAIVSVKLVGKDGMELPPHKQNGIDTVDGPLTRPFHSDLTTNYSIKLLQTSEGYAFRLLFMITYRMKDGTTCDETLLTVPFSVYSNKHNRNSLKKQ